MSQPPSIPPLPSPSSAQVPLAARYSPEQLSQIAAAKLRAVKVRRATTVAVMDAWISAVFAGFAVLSGCMGIENLIVGIALAWVAWHSFRGAAKFKRLDASGCKDLAINQCVLAACLVAYFSYALYGVTHGKSAAVSMIAGDGNYKAMGLGDMGASLDNIAETVVAAVRIAYEILIGATILAQGSTAIYYNSRKKYFDEYLAQTPAWITDLQKARIL